MEKTGRRPRARRRGTGLGEGERRCLLQLLACIALFLTVFLGRGAFPTQTEAWRESLLQLLQQDTDFQSAFSHLGRAVAEEAPVLDTLDQVWREVFGVSTLEAAEPDRTAAAVLRQESTELLPTRPGPVLPTAAPPAPSPEPTQPSPEPSQTPAQRDLGLSETVTPVMGVFSSGYGMREHPIDGGQKMHNGLDLAADLGTDVQAFADGTVEFIGEGPDLGLYIQLDHGNGVSTLYAHCSELCARTGEQVKMGEVIAKVGESGKATGPHLHLELRKDGELQDPSPYVDYVLP